MSMFKIGEIVRVKEDLKLGDRSISCVVAREMVENKGEYAIVIHVDDTTADVLNNLLFFTS